MIANTVSELIAPICDKATLALPTSRSGVSIAATRALIESGVKELHKGRPHTNPQSSRSRKTRAQSPLQGAPYFP